LVYLLPDFGYPSDPLVYLLPDFGYPSGPLVYLLPDFGYIAKIGEQVNQRA
jgi:hypothetical protein